MFEHYQRIHLLLDQGRLDEAERQIRESLGGAMDDAHLHLLLANTLCRKNRPKEAEESARVALEIEPDSAAARYFLAEAYALRERNREALEMVEEGLRLDPEDVDFFALKARILLSLDKKKEALAATEAGLRLDPDDESCRFFRSVILAQLNRREEADAESMGLLADDPEESAFFCARGWVLVERGEAEKAQEFFTEALRLDPESEGAREGLAHAMALRRPVLGAYFKLLNSVGRLPVWLAIIAGIFVFRASDLMMKPERPEWLQGVGFVCKVAICLVVYWALIVPLLYTAGLRVTRVGKNLLTRDQRMALRWAIVPIILGVIYFILWSFGGAGRLPTHTFVWFSVARLTHEFFADPNVAVRRTMAAIAWAGLAVALWIEYASYFLIVPRLAAVLGEIAAMRAGSDGVVAKEPDVEPLMQLMKNLRETMRMQSRYVVYPALVLYLVAAFSDDIRKWRRRHAPDG